MLRHLLNHEVFNRYLTWVNNFGTFIRFSENKVQRLYWNPAINAGIPLTAKDKDPVYELVFLLHDFGHFLLPDLVFTNEDLEKSELGKKVYINWRLLGESITVVLNEMLVDDFLKDKSEFKEMLTLEYDKPYKLFQILKNININDLEWLKNLFWSSYLYFCKLDDTGFTNLIDKSYPDWENIWKGFNERYHPVAKRGREWTETNFDRIIDMAEEYGKWWKVVKGFKNELDFKTISECIPKQDIPSLSDYSIWYGIHY